MTNEITISLKAQVTDLASGCIDLENGLLHKGLNKNVKEFFNGNLFFSIPKLKGCRKLGIPINQQNTVMRKLFLLCLLALSTQFISAQRIDTAHQSRQAAYKMYMQKRSNNRLVGFVMLGIGVGMVGASVLDVLANGTNGEDSLEPLLFIGGGMAVSSIPFFIIAGNNKRKAELALKGETINTGFLHTQSNYTAFALRINF